MVKVSQKQQSLIEEELRRGTSKSRIAALLDVSYDECIEMVDYVQEKIRPTVGDIIHFNFREAAMVGTIAKLLTNSAVVDIDWDQSDPMMRDVCEDRTIVNFKDIVSFDFHAD